MVGASMQRGKGQFTNGGLSVIDLSRSDTLTTVLRDNICEYPHKYTAETVRSHLYFLKIGLRGPRCSEHCTVREGMYRNELCFPWCLWCLCESAATHLINVFYCALLLSTIGFPKLAVRALPC